MQICKNCPYAHDSLFAERLSKESQPPTEPYSIFCSSSIPVYSSACLPVLRVLPYLHCKWCSRVEPGLTSIHSHDSVALSHSHTTDTGHSTTTHPMSHLNLQCVRHQISWKKLEMLGSIVLCLAGHVITSWAIFDMGSHFADQVITLHGLPYWIIHGGCLCLPIA